MTKLSDIAPYEYDRQERAALLAMAQLLSEILDVQKKLLAVMGGTARSSVELAENAKGAVQVAVKTYADSPALDEACIEAVASFRTLKQEVEQGQMEQWRATVEQLQRERAS